MTQADRVHSTQPTNTPIDTTRRRFIAISAGASVASVGALTVAAMPVTAPDSAACAADPIYAAIDRHRGLAKAYDAAWKLRADCEDFGTLTEEEEVRVNELDDATDAAYPPLEAAAMDLFDTEPTTLAGIITALCYMRTQHRKGGEHMARGSFEDEDGESYTDWRDAWLETLTQAVLQLDDAAVQS
jgi:hypothetical protein